MAHLDFIKKITSLHLLLFAELSSSQTIPGNGLPNKKKKRQLLDSLFKLKITVVNREKFFLNVIVLFFKLIHLIAISLRVSR